LQVLTALILFATPFAQALASDLIVDFSDPQTFARFYDAVASSAATPGLWNVASGRLQAPLAPAGVVINMISFGDGSNGSFNDGPSNSTAGITVGAGSVIFNTDVQADYSFSSFSLNGPFTLTVTGSQPLVIRSLGAITIAGAVDLNGAPGAANSAGAAPLGGAGLAGAFGGGNGGLPGVPACAQGTAAVVGLPSAAGVPRGGGIGTCQNGTATEEGGGGGCNGVDATGTNASPGIVGGVPGTNGGVCTPGVTYALRGLAFETTFSGGAGGGGGGAYNGAPSARGGGGGAGGGAIRLVALGAVTVTGTVTSSGGLGGRNENGTAPDCGGGGGGGSGGSIWIQSAQTAAGAGPIVHAGGAGGDPNTNVGCAGISEGGAGSQGALRIDTAAGVHGFVTLIPATSLSQRPVSSPVTGTYTIVSKAFDFSDSLYEFGAPTETLGCGAAPAAGTLSVTYEGSSDGFTFSRSATAATISSLNEFPFLRIRVEITSASSNPPCLTALSIPYQQQTRTELELAGGLFCGQIKNFGGGGGGSGGPQDPWKSLGDFAVILGAALAAVRAAKVRLTSESHCSPSR